MRIALRTAILAVTLCLAVGAGRATASTDRAKLTIAPIGSDRYSLVASADYGASYTNGVDIAVRLWGDDEWYDDLLYSVPGTIYQGTWDMHFERQFTVSGSTLNEDWGADEIYADARLYDHKTGKLLLTLKTNLLYGSWS